MELELLENGRVIGTFPSHTKAKNAKWWKEQEAKQDWLDLSYCIRRKEK
jgi:hypothetical protein